MTDYNDIQLSVNSELYSVRVEPRKTLADTLREDWELHIDDDGKLRISYSCSCDSCSFRHRFQHEEQVPL
jgi:aerobic-type carbon monoxide dehydrogenase small subunit (CoxS/CutS family)